MRKATLIRHSVSSHYSRERPTLTFAKSSAHLRMSKIETESPTEAATACRAYHTLLTPNSSEDGCICQCGKDTPKTDHVLGTIDALRKEVQQLGTSKSE